MNILIILRLIPEILHPSPLDTQESLPELFKETNNIEPRIPHALQSSDFHLLPPKKIKTLIFCSGQVYYNLFKTRQVNALSHIAIVRVEQICPFPFWEVKKVVDFYEGLEEIVWAQEESMNSGCMFFFFDGLIFLAWLHVEPRFHTAIRESKWYKSGNVKSKKNHNHFNTFTFNRTILLHFNYYFSLFTL